ncbi:uncharacterized protein PRCAT00000004001 [Priceomyces carsonii]|uniref:uncharacterized protein n=1 Tax=Priceomyces carsonii TaxID=28549 RepID=UPI002EDBA7E5|nr:unnamed protein product [Priceomyces carsonii]
MSSIPYNLQYYVEKDRNNLFQWLSFLVGVCSFLLYGIGFHWLPKLLRERRKGISKSTLVFNILKGTDLINICFPINVPFVSKFYVHPGLILLCLGYCAINAVFSFIKTVDLDYQPRYYIVSKRLGKLAVGNLLLLTLLIIKSDIVMFATGLKQDRLQFFHRWSGRLVWVMATLHLALAITYWLRLNFSVMILIPPQIFGMISYGSLCILSWGSIRVLRKFAYDFFLIQHKIFSGIMFLFVLFHNPESRVIIILAIHLVVLDKVIGRIVTFIRRKFSPNGGMSQFRILDEETLEVTISLGKSSSKTKRWYKYVLPSVKTWKAGQYVYLNVPKVSLFQYHPFTIASLASSGDMKLLIKHKKGFTKKLFRKVSQLNASNSMDEGGNLNSVNLKVLISGPFGGLLQPLITFDSLLFLPRE